MKMGGGVSWSSSSLFSFLLIGWCRLRNGEGHHQILAVLDVDFAHRFRDLLAQ